MNTNKTGGEAFPTLTGEVNGMTLLDYFAAKAMNGMLSNSIAHDGYSQKYSEMSFDETAKLSYELAAAMIEERKKYI